MLGEAFYHCFKQNNKIKCTDIDVNTDWLSYMDFCDTENYMLNVKEFAPDFLFHLGAYTDLEFCETHPEETYITNTDSVKNATKIANELNIPLLYISTAGIFDGQKEYYSEDDKPNPLGHYAKSKYEAELFVIKEANKFLICRAGWMMGGGPEKDKKFINKLINQIINGAETLYIVNDKDGTPTYTHDFAKNVKLLIKNNHWGLFNMVCGGQTSRLEVAQELIKLLGLTNKISIKEVGSDYFKHEYFAARPVSERLVNKRLDSLGLNIMRDWKVALKEYLYKEYLEYVK